MPEHQEDNRVSHEGPVDFGFEEPKGEKQGSTPAQVVTALVFIAVVLIALLLFWNYIEPDSVQEPRDPTFVDSVFANPAVVAAARIVLLSIAIVLQFGSIYVATSVVVRMRRRQWLRRAGPFESHLG